MSLVPALYSAKQTPHSKEIASLRSENLTLNGHLMLEQRHHSKARHRTLMITQLNSRKTDPTAVKCPALPKVIGVQTPTQNCGTVPS